ncbi:MAG: 50S ribosomal protein L10 [Candidatus Pacearchaeota archaeon]|nr:50S ribosomal protein L10 [Candidatus Pacearchaeota archaeon]
MKIKDKSERKREIPEKKKKDLVNLVEALRKKKTIMVVSIENISSLQFQQIKRSLKDKAIVKVVKKSFMLKALEELKKTRPKVEGIEKGLVSGFAILLSDEDPFELSALLSENKFPAKAKAGQISPKDIILEAGPTDLLAGPVISELTKAGIKAGIEGGKIAIKERCVLVKEGERISEEAAAVLARLEMAPFVIGFEPLVAYNDTEDQIYENIKIDKVAMLKEFTQSASRALSLALYISYPTKETIALLLSKASGESSSILNLVKNLEE